MGTQKMNLITVKKSGTEYYDFNFKDFSNNIVQFYLFRCDALNAAIFQFKIDNDNKITNQRNIS